MATAAKTSAPDVVGSILLIPVNDIEMGERLREVDQEWAATLGRMMKVDGQDTPIDVCRLPGRRTWTLVTGGHRLTGASLAGMVYIKAVEVSNDAIDRKLREIRELLFKKGADPLDRAACVGDMHDLLRARAGLTSGQDGRVFSAQARWQKVVKSEAIDATDIMSDAYGIAAKVADQLGLNERTIRRDLTLRRRLTPADVAVLRRADHPILRNGAQLLALAKLDDGSRRETIALLVEGTVKSVAEANALRSQKAKPSPQDKVLSAFIGSFGRMGLAEKRGALQQLAGLLTPSLIETLAEAIDLPTRPAPVNAADRQRTLDRLLAVRDAIDAVKDDETVSDAMGWERVDALFKARSAVHALQFDVHASAVPVGDAKVERALRGASNVLGTLIEGAVGVSDETIEAAYEACEQALHGCGPAISNDDWEEQA